MTIPRSEFRPLFHAATGLVALGMGVFPRWFNVGGAVFGVLVGWVLFPLTPLEARLRRPGEPFLCGLRTYPVAVLGLVVLLRPESLAAAAWAILAAGDAAASIVGRRVPSRPLFGHPKATWAGSLAFLGFGWAAGILAGRVVEATGGGAFVPSWAVGLAALAAAAIDLVRIPPDDNVPIAAAAGLTLAACAGVLW